VRYTHRVGRRMMPVYVNASFSRLAGGVSHSLKFTGADFRNVATIKIGCMF
jgi:hypothetical protein